jgi:N-acetylglucosaminyldiphosphoundecaprenol N-acetyl-beta-D-mannosaminyltransferase
VAIEKLAGSDLVFKFARVACDRGHSIFLLGDDEETNSEACAVLGSKYQVRVNGYAPPHANYPFEPEIDERILEVIREHRPQILLVALGMPKQEMWINDHRLRLEQIGVRWAIGIGGALGFVSGRELRAPVFVQRAGMEGIWRLFQRPSRWKRFIRALRVLRYAAT